MVAYRDFRDKPSYVVFVRRFARIVPCNERRFFNKENEHENAKNTVVVSAYQVRTSRRCIS